MFTIALDVSFGLLLLLALALLNSGILRICVGMIFTVLYQSFFAYWLGYPLVKHCSRILKYREMRRRLSSLRGMNPYDPMRS